jgi:AcrR family transcriptional regulator
VNSTLDAPAPGRTRRNRGSELVRSRLLAAAITEFSAHGFEGASTRAIADHADAHQSQIKYHFDTKDELWRRCLEQLLSEVDAAIAEQPGVRSDNPRDVFEAVIRGLVAFAAERPELNRIMMHEATSPSPRLTWLVETRIGQRRADLIAAWNQLVSTDQAAPVDADVVYHALIGAASLLYANAPEAVLMGLHPDDPDLVQRHADGLVAMFLRSNN